MTTRVALIMAGGTGGHIFPGLALAHALRAQGWTVHWLGGQGANGPSMESELVPPFGYAFEAIAFGGVRGKGWLRWLVLPWSLGKAMLQSFAVLRRVRPSVVIGMGGYISVPAGLAAALSGRALLLHEQNSVMGTANKLLSMVAKRVYTAFPNVLPKGRWVGNPLRAEFLTKAEPSQRFAQRHGPLKLLVVGGSLGARALNTVVPQALALLPNAQRPSVLHQSGAKMIDELRSAYATAGVEAELTPFIQDTAEAFAQADLIICRAGASTVTEIAAVGAAAIFVPFPAAIDDHQTHNAEFLVSAQAAWLLPQSELSAVQLASMLGRLDRAELLLRAERAKRLQKLTAVDELVAACAEVAP